MSIEERTAGTVLDLLQQLNPKQQEAVTHVEGPLLVLAGAGSGKTRVITYRVAYLINACGVSPWNILAVTFTNKAAGEMRERIHQLVSEKAEGVWVSTFHSLCARLIRQHVDKLDLQQGFTIYDRSDQMTVVRKAMEESTYQDSRSLKPATFLNAISKAKSSLLSPIDVLEQAKDDFQELSAAVYGEYEKILRHHNALDFDDLLVYGVRLLSEHEDVRERYQKRFHHVLVDEYQDTNHPQYLLAHILSKKHGNLCVVGDDDQSIYRWRGAQLSNILEFERDHRKVKVIRLEQNYRSTKTILAAANAVVSQNRGRRKKKLWTDLDDGESIGVACLPDETSEARWIARQMLELRESHNFRWSDMAVFYRINALSRSIEEELLKEGIAYTVVGGTSFYDRKEIKDVLAYLRLLLNPYDGAAFARIANEPRRKLGLKSVEQILLFAGYHNTSVLRSCARADENDNLSSVAKSSAKNFARMYTQWHKAMKESDLKSLINKVLRDSGYENMLTNDPDPTAKTRWENVGELVSGVVAFEEERRLLGVEFAQTDEALRAFMENVALVSDVDEWKDKEDRVTLMTLHSAKGLEFPVVFLVAMEQGILPHQRSMNSKDEMEEERRLCYVGMTRAKERVFLTRSYSRRLFGRSVRNPTSVFLREIPDAHMKTLSSATGPSQTLFDLGRTGKSTNTVRDLPTPRISKAEFEAGDTVLHRTFGLGVVLEVVGNGPSARITVDFQNFGKRTLIQGYAKLKKV